jgi:hypothetical protein
MIKNFGNTYVSVKVELDGNSFEGCKFEDCILEFGATAPVSLVGNRIINCRWSFVGAAGDTIAFLRAITQDSGVDGEKFILSLFRGPVFTFHGSGTRSVVTNGVDVKSTVVEDAK